MGFLPDALDVAGSREVVECPRGTLGDRGRRPRPAFAFFFVSP
jgi:hypothetical protein